MNFTRLLAPVIAALTFGLGLSSHAAVSLTLVQGSVCTGASSASFTTGGSDITVTVCATTTTEQFCGASFSLVEASAVGVFSAVAPRTRGASFDTDGNPAYAFPIAIQTPAAAIDLGATVFPALVAGTYPVATVTIRPLAGATASAYTIGLASASTATGATCATEVTGGALAVTPLVLTKTLPATTATFTALPTTLALTEGAAGSTVAVNCTGTIGTPSPVVIAVGSTGSGFSVSPASLSFSTCTAQNVTVTPRALTAGSLPVQSGTVTFTTATAGATAPSSVAITVTDTESPAVYSVTKATATVTEGNATTDTLTVTCAGAFTGGLTSGSVQYAITGLTSSDISTVPAPLTGTLNFAACNTSQSIVISPRTNDSNVQGNKTGNFAITSPVAGSLGAATGTITVNDDDTPQTVSVAVGGSPATENGGILLYTFTRAGGNASAQAATLIANLTPITVNAARYTIGAACSGSTITFAAGSPTVTCAVTGVDTLAIDGNVNVLVALGAAPSGGAYTVSTTAGSATGVIADDDTAQTVSVAVGGSPATENGGILLYTFTRSGGNPAAQAATLAANLTPITVNAARYTIGAACSGSTITFAAGSPTVTCAVTGVNTAVVDGNVNVLVALGAAPSGGAYTVSTTAGSATGVIADDDIGVSVTATVGTVIEGQPAVFNVNCNGAVGNFTVVYTLTGQDAGTVATPASPATLACTTATSKLTVTVPTIDDAIIGNTRSVKLKLVSVAAAGTGVLDVVLGTPSELTITVTDNDAPTVIPTMSPIALGLMALMIFGFAAFGQRPRINK